MLSAVLGARQKQQLHFAPAEHVNTSEACWNFFLSQAAFPCRPKTEMRAMASCPALPRVNPSPPGHAARVGSCSQLVSGLFSDTANVDIRLCQMSQKISRKCSDLPNSSAKGIGHSGGSLPLTPFSELRYCNSGQTCLSSSWACSAQVCCLMGSPL